MIRKFFTPAAAAAASGWRWRCFRPRLPNKPRRRGARLEVLFLGDNGHHVLTERYPQLLMGLDREDQPDLHG
ncbi:MAG: hypothetical protein R3F11_28890 [Verrucomicrobiales bacterium]